MGQFLFTFGYIIHIPCSYLRGKKSAGNKCFVVFSPDSSDSVSRELVEAGLVDGKDMIVGE